MSEHIGHIISEIRSTLPTGVELVAVSKYHPSQAIQAAYDAGQRVFGESRVNELLQKSAVLPTDIRWHFIGHLQTNKVKNVVGVASLIESVDSERLLALIDEMSVRKGVVSRVLMQVHVAAEDTKFGWSPEELLEYFGKGAYKDLKATRICGLMGMATNTDDTARIDADFSRIEALAKEIGEIAPDLKEFNILSMGMSDDYPIALKHGATHVRIGSRIFGARS